MAEALFPVFAVPAVSGEEAPAVARYAPAPLWDYDKGDFAADGSGRVVYGSGRDAWIQWCAKTLMTQRWAHLGYSGIIGVESDEALALPDRKAQESALERTAAEALLADPFGRTRSVRDFTFDWQGGDSLRMSCTAYGADGNSAEIFAELQK